MWWWAASARTKLNKRSEPVLYIRVEFVVIYVVVDLIKTSLLSFKVIIYKAQKVQIYASSPVLGQVSLVGTASNSSLPSLIIFFCILRAL